MTSTVLTNKEFWSEYWTQYVPRAISDVPFSDLYQGLPGPGSSFIEIGGFPGTFAVYFQMRRQYKVTLLDYFIEPGVVEKLERVNGLQEGTIRVIEADFLTFQTNERYDVVFSAGFLEHFDNTEDVLRRHCELLKPGGMLFVSMPNFTGLHGWVQKVLHNENYRAHNLDAMNMRRLRRIGEKLGLAEFSVEYYGVPRLHLEPNAPIASSMRRWVGRLSRLIEHLPGRNRVLSPNIVIRGRK
jgi:SAM-dependent methyltransferase